MPGDENTLAFGFPWDVSKIDFYDNQSLHVIASLSWVCDLFRKWATVTDKHTDCRAELLSHTYVQHEQLSPKHAHIVSLSRARMSTMLFSSKLDMKTLLHLMCLGTSRIKNPLALFNTTNVQQNHIWCGQVHRCSQNVAIIRNRCQGFRG